MQKSTKMALIYVGTLLMAVGVIFACQSFELITKWQARFAAILTGAVVAFTEIKK